MNNGLTIKYTSSNNYVMGIISHTSLSMETNILEINSYFSSINSGVTIIGYSNPPAATSAPILNEETVVSTGGISGVSGSILSTWVGFIKPHRGAGHAEHEPPLPSAILLRPLQLAERRARAGWSPCRPEARNTPRESL